MSGPRRGPSPFSSIPTRRIGLDTLASPLFGTRGYCRAHAAESMGPPWSAMARYGPRGEADPAPLTKGDRGNRFARFQKWARADAGEGCRRKSAREGNGDEQGSAQEVQDAAHREAGRDREEGQADP